MKKILAAAIILILTATLANAQRTSFNIGFDVAGSMGKFNILDNGMDSEVLHRLFIK